MIGSLSGTIVTRTPRRLLLEVGAVGYLVNISDETARMLPPGTGTVRLLTHLVVREDVLDLYGFATAEEREYFELLIAVPGIGPKSALAILSIASPTTLQAAVASNDVSYLTQVSGIGRKSAEKIILELRDKIGTTSGNTEQALADDKDTMLALEALGYSRDEARTALRSVPPNLATTAERLKAALRTLTEK